MGIKSPFRQISVDVVTQFENYFSNFLKALQKQMQNILEILTVCWKHFCTFCNPNHSNQMRCTFDLKTKIFFRERPGNQSGSGWHLELAWFKSRKYILTIFFSWYLQVQSIKCSILSALKLNIMLNRFSKCTVYILGICYIHCLKKRNPVYSI